jgi:hypothetical protein
VLVPTPESTCPSPRHIHLPDHDVFPPDVAHEIECTVDQHPPEIGVVTLVEKLDSGFDACLGARVEQFAELGVAQALEQIERSKVVNVHRGDNTAVLFSVQTTVDEEFATGGFGQLGAEQGRWRICARPDVTGEQAAGDLGGGPRSTGEAFLERAYSLWRAG